MTNVFVPHFDEVVFRCLRLAKKLARNNPAYLGSIGGAFQTTTLLVNLCFHDLLASYAMHHAPSPPRNHQPSGRLGSSRWQSCSS